MTILWLIFGVGASAIFFLLYPLISIRWTFASNNRADELRFTGFGIGGSLSLAMALYAPVAFLLYAAIGICQLIFISRIRLAYQFDAIRKAKALNEKEDQVLH